MQNDQNNDTTDNGIMQNREIRNDESTQAVEVLTKSLEECQKQVAEWKDRYVRVTADLENYRKRTIKDMSIWKREAQASVIRDLLPIADDFERAFTQVDLENITAEVRVWIDGFLMIQKSLQKLLDTLGVTPVKTVGVFDPELHEAITHVESADHKSGDIVHVFQKGYQLDGMVLRPARVSVAK